MQIHELNNYNGNLNGNAYIAVDNGQDTGKVPVPNLTAELEQSIEQLDNDLNARIDNIVGGGDAPSAAEVTDGRLGASALGSIQYTSLGAAIRGQATILSDDIAKFADAEGVKISNLVGGTIEDISSVDFELNENHIYKLIIPSFTPRAWLSSGYMVLQVNVYYDNGTNKRTGFYTKGLYPNTPYIEEFDNSAGNITKVTVQLRPENKDTVVVAFADIENDKAIEAIAPLINEYFAIRSEELDFSNASIGSTYQGREFAYYVPVGASIEVEITAPDNDTNQTYIVVDDVYHVRLSPSALNTGYGSRKFTFTNNYDRAVGYITLVIVKVNQQAIYTVDVYNANNLIRRVEDLEALVGGFGNYPQYYRSQIESAINTISSNMAAAKKAGETFVFISDVHWSENSKHSPALIKAITDKLPIENTVFGGDVFNGGPQAESIAYMIDFRSQLSKASQRLLSMFGNHDSNALDGGVAFENNEFYTFMQKQSDYYVKYGSYFYYYMDNPTTETRYIFLDTRGSEPDAGFTQMEEDWLEDTLQSTPDGYSVLVFAHVIYYPNTGGSWADPSTWRMSTFMTSVCSILDAENAQNRIKIEAIFGGHTHLDYNSESAGGIPIVIIDCDTRQTNSSTGHAEGTINEQCFDVVTVDYTAKKIKCVRIGRGSDRVIAY